MLLIIDHYDSFTYNLYQAFAEIGEKDVRVVKHDQISLEEIERLRPDGIVLSPGPGRPEGLCIQAIERFMGKIPILGVCLGHQAIGIAFGAKVVQAGAILHGKHSLVFHEGKGLFEGMPVPFEAGRYHSLIVEEVPQELIVDAVSEGLVMGMRHKEHPIFGIQFHPESILTVEGKVVLKNFLRICHDRKID